MCCLDEREEVRNLWNIYTKERVSSTPECFKFFGGRICGLRDCNQYRLGGREEVRDFLDRLQISLLEGMSGWRNFVI